MQLYRCFAAIIVSLFAIQNSASADLVLNGDFSSGNTGFTSDYTFNFGSGPKHYWINTSPNIVNAAFNDFADRTGSGVRNMMIVDGAFNQTPKAIVWSESITISANTNYTFSAWAATIATSTGVGVFADVQFNINNTALGHLDFSTLQPDKSTAGVWNNFNSVWNSGSATTASITIVDLQTNNSNSGNDFALDDISFNVTAVPEPTSFAMLGIAALYFLRTRLRHE